MDDRWMRLVENRLNRLEAQDGGPDLGAVMGQFMAIPGLRGLWPLNSTLDGGNAPDLSNQGRTLTWNGNPMYTINLGGQGCIGFDGTGDFLSRASEAGLNIIGTEVTINPAWRGLTMGGWFFPQLASTAQAFIGKGDGASNAGTAYGITLRAADNKAQAAVYSGSNAVAQVTTVLDFSTWHFIVMKYTPSTSIDIFMDGVKTSNGSNIFASINSVAAQFCIGAVGAGLQPFTGFASLCFLSAMTLPDFIINRLFQMSRLFFGV